MPHRRLSIESYPSEYMEFFKRACLERVELHFDAAPPNSKGTPGSVARATHLAIQLNQFRAALKAAGHELYEKFAKAQISRPRLNEDGSATLIGHPRFTEMKAVFNRAGITAEKIDTATEDSLDDFLKGFAQP